MNPELVEDVIKEGVESLCSKLGVVKTVKFLQLIGVSRGDTVKEIEEKTGKMSKEEALQFIEKVKKEKKELWKKMGLV
ncbi:MAG: hypothetical protein QMC80_03790 [Thermoplasmatales archaeon]|nr:hypothetical protein [Thermoplasmatales archaeon]